MKRTKPIPELRRQMHAYAFVNGICTTCYCRFAQAGMRQCSGCIENNRLKWHNRKKKK